MISLKHFNTVLGEMVACATPEGLCLLEFADRRLLSWELEEISKRLEADVTPGNNDILTLTVNQLSDYFEGNRKEFDIPLIMTGTDFQRSVWERLLKIPYGETRSYQELANELGNAKSVRAVGTANGFNKMSIVIPCHRVIGSNGHLVGYGGGLKRKRWLLDHERFHRRYVGSQQMKLF
jgi:AraC family transcriptional regulator of adaptative response/methylated-DNA-[protein]-cysteine methyltransferase